MVMLDILGGHFVGEIASQYEDLEFYGCARPNVLAAVFNHGTRPSAEDDVEFVRKVCDQEYCHLLCYTAKSNLGENASEALAREHRYGFLHDLAYKMSYADSTLILRPDCETWHLSPPKVEPVYIYTAHHLDDLIETVAINLLRGTGWRGLAVLDAPMIRRPFLEPENMPKSLRKLVPFDKKTILSYAADFELTYRQDPTNNEDKYLRNRVRQKLSNFDKKREIYDLWQKQKQLKREIDELVEELMPEDYEPWQRSWFEGLDENVALELLRAGTLRAGISATRPQLERFRQAILTYAPGKAFNLPKDRLVTFTKTDFWIV